MATVVAVEAKSAPHTWFVPCWAASVGERPFSRKRTMFSNAMMAASRTMPTAKARPASEMTLSVRPAASMMTKVASKEAGIASATINVARNFRRNHQRQMMAKQTPSARLLATISMERSM